MKNIYFVQPNSSYGSEICLPYAPGAVLACAFGDSTVKKEYSLGGIFYKKEEIKELLERFEKPYLVGFSCYIWNFRYNKLLAQELKKLYPDCLVLFGGHSVENNSSELLESCDYIDFLIHNEGEVPFRELLKALSSGAQLENVPNLSYRHNGKIYKTENRLFDISEFPSPYTNGLFDDIIAGGDRFYGIIETNRGCPFDCVYCDWGNHSGRVRMFSAEHVKQDIEWLSRNKISYCICADANFGMFPRDEEIADMIIAAKKSSGFPDRIQFCFTKNSDDRVFEINRKLSRYGLTKGATISLQTLSEAALEGIGRSNMSFDSYERLVRRYNEADIPAYTDMILGLPGETLESFCEGIGKLLDAGQHTSINVFNCEMLVNSRLGQKSVIDKYALKTARCSLNRHHSELSDSVEEENRVIVSTSSMSESDWVQANLFVAAVGCFHCLGLLQYFALYLHNEKNVGYTDFYMQLLEYLKENPHTAAGEVFADIEKKLSDCAKGLDSCEYYLPEFGNVNWPLEEGAFLLLVDRLERFLTEIPAFLSRFDFDGIEDELMSYQKNTLKRPGVKKVSFETAYNFREYFENIKNGTEAVLKKQKYLINIEDPCYSGDKKSYARFTVWYGRKGGKNFYTSEMTEREF